MNIVVILGLLTLCLASSFPASAQAQTLEALPAQPGNLPPGFYPVPPCAKPVLEDDKGATRELANANEQSAQLVMDNYHRRVERYNKAVIAFNECAKTYIQNSRYDIERILSTVNAAVAEVRGTAPPPPPVATGNLPTDFYPRSPCVKPDERTLGAQPAMTDIKAMMAYNLKVETFNQQAVTFSECLKAYQHRAQYDIQEIQAAIRPAPTNGVRAPAARQSAK